jgi:SAM-dependent methyltransferase
MSQFNPGQATLELLGCYDSFMESIDTVCDMGCGNGEDLEWWATRSLEDDDGNAIPLNIKCTGVDLKESLTVAHTYSNITYERRDFETNTNCNKRYDVIWCNNSFQYALNPLETLKLWNSKLTNGGMLAMTVPSTFEVTARQTVITQDEYTYHHYTTVNLIHMLAINGFETAFMKKQSGWISVVAYKTDHEAFDPRTTRWYNLVDKGLLPASAEDCINSYGYLRQDQLTLAWLDGSLYWFGND